MSDFDTDESGIIEFKEFVKMMTMKPCTEDTVEDIANVYYHIDYDYKGINNYD
jgi:Ca2+-binding EF-hand superfamily protein